jgi:enterochelin esterase-like enzyme
MRQFKQFLFAGLSLFLLALYPMAAQTTLPDMPLGGPDNSTFDKSGRYPAGTTNHTSFYSTVAGKNVDMWVYTPPGYSTSQTYGVVFCYQGIGTDAGTIFYDWCVNAGIVCDNLIGEGKISKGVIIVAIDDQFAGDYSNVRDMTINDAIPYIDSHYSTYGDADHRGVYGYSWGGGYAFNVGCENLDYFHYISPSSAAPDKDGDNTLFPNGGAKAKQVLKCLFLSWGQNDYQSIIDANVACDSYCNTNGISHYKWVAAGQGHTGGTWRPAIWNFLQLADRAGISGSVIDDGTLKVEYASVTNDNPKQIQVTMSKSILKSNAFNGFTVKIDNQAVTIDSVVLRDTNQLAIHLHVNVLKNNTILLSYSNGNVVSIDNKNLIGFNDMSVDNLLKGASPRMAELKTNKDGDTLIAKFTMKMQLPIDISALALKATYNGNISIPFSKVSFFNTDSTLLAFPLDQKVYADYKLLLSYSGNNISSADSGLLKTFSDLPATNYSKGLPVKISAGKIEYDGSSGVFEFTKPLAAVTDKSGFTLKVNNISTSFNDFYNLKNMIRFTLPGNLHYGDSIKASYIPGKVMAADLGLLEAFSDYPIINQVKEPVWVAIPAKIEAENYYSQSGISTENTSDTGGGLDVGWIDNGDWLEYAIKNNTSDSNYEITCRIASPSGNGKIDFYLDNKKISQVTVPNTGGWQTWQSVVANISIGQGKHYLKIVVVNGGFNVNYYNINKVATGIENLHEDGIKMYPNPVSKELIIGSTDFKYNKVEIIDITGKTVLSRLTAYESELHMQVNLPNGIYIVKLSNEKQFQLKRIIIDNN